MNARWGWAALFLTAVSFLAAGILFVPDAVRLGAAPPTAERLFHLLAFATTWGAGLRVTFIGGIIVFRLNWSPLPDGDEEAQGGKGPWYRHRGRVLQERGDSEEELCRALKLLLVTKNSELSLGFYGEEKFGLCDNLGPWYLLVIATVLLSLQS